MIKQYICEFCTHVFKKNEQLAEKCPKCFGATLREIELDEYFLYLTDELKAELKLFKQYYKESKEIMGMWKYLKSWKIMNVLSQVRPLVEIKAYDLNERFLNSDLVKQIENNTNLTIDKKGE